MAQCHAVHSTNDMANTNRVGNAETFTLFALLTVCVVLLVPCGTHERL